MSVQLFAHDMLTNTSIRKHLSKTTVFRDRLGTTKLGVARVDLVISIALQGYVFTQASVDI